MTVLSDETRRHSKGTDTRERILAEARRMLVEEGYDALVIRCVADNVGIKLGNLQYYFPTRDELLIEVIRIEAQSDLDDLRTVLGESLDPREALSRLVQLLVVKWRGDSGVVFSTMGFLAIHNEAYKQACIIVYEAFYAELESAIASVDPDLSQDVYKVRARLLTALIDGAAMQIQVGPKRRYLEAVTETAMQVVLPDKSRAPFS